MFTHNDDPYRDLENLNSAAAQAVISHAQTETQKYLADKSCLRLADDITALLQDEKQIPFCQEHRARMYHFYQSDDYPKGVYRVCAAAGYRSGLPEWEILFSVVDFDEILGDDVHLQGVSHYEEAPHRVLLNLSSGGTDAAYTVEFDLREKHIVAGGFHFPLGKNHIAWRDENSVWVCPAWDERQLSQAGCPRQVWLLTRGQNFDEALPVYEMDASGMMVNAWRYLDGQGTPADFIEAASGFFSKQYFQAAADGSLSPLALPNDCDIVGFLAGQLLVQLRSDWQRSHRRLLSGSLLAIKLNKGKLGEAAVLFEPLDGQAIECVETSRQFIIIVFLDHVNSCLKLWRFEHGIWQETAAPPLPRGVLEITDQPWGGDVVYLAVSDFLTPLTLYTLDLRQMELSVMRRQSAQFNTGGISVHQFQAASADGTLIPYYHVGKNTGSSTPTLVYVYGGFAEAQLPHYLGALGKHWLEKGFAFVLANVRGGGELGAAWHTAAQGVNKYKSTDDLLAVLHDLAQRGLADAAHTAVQGGSNGGLVAASAFCREPKSMAALVCEVPLTDMLRYPYLSAGALWLEEYGNPENDADHIALRALSPYHQLNEQQNYPPAFISTHLNDDRVHPAHALKFYARLAAFRQPVRLFISQQGGHEGGATQRETAEELAVILCFLYETVAQEYFKS
ncbi:prolyl oligopeptidase family serine peptidase [Stenoxybacter acetivorans]|uniref:prolyl oligopeptidase family serine peptidase n=1 Tax=Stenoxybacter acetivorans TaxID=422441 RepID=UPI00056A1AC3|nr:prolyl oligopeptidase family serine peptidase [Stenoxybacter acetivorans]